MVKRVVCRIVKSRLLSEHESIFPISSGFNGDVSSDAGSVAAVFDRTFSGKDDISGQYQRIFDKYAQFDDSTGRIFDFFV